METKIEMIPVELIDQHPDNPRSELGNLSELVASIRRSGVMQNLTLVDNPTNPERYRVIIGHRRLAAARTAGLEKVPCVVRQMDPIEQLATMMAENMQRCDLTLADQVGGVQMMMDLGEDISSISKRTGMSKSVVRSRADIAKNVSRDKLEAAGKRGATLMEIAEAAKIENEKDREEVLDAAGTDNFRMCLARAKENVKIRGAWGKACEKLSGWARPTDNTVKLGRYVRGIDILDKNADFDAPKDLDPAGYAFRSVMTQYISIYTCVTDDDLANRENTRRTYEEQEAARRKRCEAEEQVAKRAKQLRDDFVLTFRGGASRNGLIPAVTMAEWTMLQNRYFEPMSEAEYRKNIGRDGNGKLSIGEVEQDVERDPVRAILIAAYTRLSSICN